MTTPSTGRWLAQATGAAASVGALYILLKDDVLAGKWSDAYILVPIMVGIAIAAGHLAWAALASRKYLSALGFALAFGLGSLLTVYTSVGKQAAHSDAVTLAATASNDLRRSKEEELSRARQRLSDAQQSADRERGTACGRKCLDWEMRAREVASHIQTLESELRAMAPVPVAPTATRFSRLVAALTGADPEKVKAMIVLFEPFGFALLFEATAIVALGYGFGQPRRRAPAPSPQRAPRPRITSSRADRDDVIDWVRAYRARNGRDPQIPELQAAFPLPRTTAWRYAKSR